MGCMQQAVLEFDEEVRVPWRPRLVSGTETDEAATVRPLLTHPSRRSPSRVGACRPSESAGRPGVPVRRAAAGPGRPSAPGPVSGRTAKGGRPPGGRPGGVRLRPTRRARRLALVLALAVGVAFGSWLGPLLDSGESDLRLAGEATVVVQRGDTLWSIATSLGGDGDVRAVVDRIQELNDLGNAPLLPGQILHLP